MNTLNAEELKAARDWIKDCQGCFKDLEDDSDVDALTDTEVLNGIRKHFSGGIEAFKEVV